MSLWDLLRRSRRSNNQIATIWFWPHFCVWGWTEFFWTNCRTLCRSRSKISKIQIIHFRECKSAKNLYFDRFSWILRQTGFVFEKSAFVSLSALFSINFMPSFRKILWLVFEKNSGQTNWHGWIYRTYPPLYRTNLQNRWVQQKLQSTPVYFGS